MGHFYADFSNKLSHTSVAFLEISSELKSAYIMKPFASKTHIYFIVFLQLSSLVLFRPLVGFQQIAPQYQVENVEAPPMVIFLCLLYLNFIALV